jgi:hypothetical protein
MEAADKTNFLGPLSVMWAHDDQFFKPFGHYDNSEAAMRGDYATM